ncbi:MAG: hypothetical protein ACI379_15535 [Nocardioides sp.]|uniref:hypothetical protein n=1 Tax=Nocardioides sp. TaxID=35761 RepID=UPI003F11268B
MIAPGPLPQHGLGGAADLPIPASFAIVGGAAALAASFVILLVAWRSPRFAVPAGTRPLPERWAALLDSRGWRVAWQAMGLAFLAFMLVPAFLGPDTLVNPVFGVVYVWLWVGIVPASLLFGRAFRAVSPARTLVSLLGRLTGGGVARFPAWLGYWPAAVMLFAFVWLELVYPQSTYLGPVRLWFTIYFVVVVLGGLVFGEKWVERADPFEVYSTLLAHLSPWGRDEDGTRVWISPLRHLARLTPESGLVATTAVLLGSTAFDSFKGSVTWIRFVQAVDVDAALVNTLCLLAWVVAVGVVFALATMLTPAASLPRRELPARLAHSLVPIIVGYMVAHYFSYFVVVGQQTLTHLSDPLGTGANLFGTADLPPNRWLSDHVTFLASTKVVAIVTGHVLGVVAAHDRALELLGRRNHVVGQLGLLVVMVLFTYMGLYLLFGA